MISLGKQTQGETLQWRFNLPEADKRRRCGKVGKPEGLRIVTRLWSNRYTRWIGFNQQCQSGQDGLKRLMRRFKFYSLTKLGRAGKEALPNFWMSIYRA